MDNNTITIDIDDTNDLLFKVSVEGSNVKSVRARLICESDDMSYMIDGRSIGSDDLVEFKVPPMVGKMKPGAYPARVEVIVDNRCFSPIEFRLELKKTVSVVAENITYRKQTLVTASPMQVKNTVSSTSLRQRFLSKNR